MSHKASADATNGLGEQVRDFRKSWDMSLRAFARAIDRSPSWVSKFERGTEKPGEETVLKIAEVLGWPQFSVDTALLKLGVVPSEYVEILQRNPHLLEMLKQFDGKG